MPKVLRVCMGDRVEAWGVELQSLCALPLGPWRHIEGHRVGCRGQNQALYRLSVCLIRLSHPASDGAAEGWM